MTTNLSAVVGGASSTDMGRDSATSNAPSVVDVAMSNREFAALRGRKADERDQQRLEQEAQARVVATAVTKQEPRAHELVTRERILDLLSDAELSRVSHAGFQLRPGEEYLELTHLERGVRGVGAEGSALGEVTLAQVLPKSALEATTWAASSLHSEGARSAESFPVRPDFVTNSLSASSSSLPHRRSAPRP